MKKILVAGILSLVLLTGCGKEEQIECTNQQKSFGVEMNTTISVKLKGNDFVNLSMTIDAILPENLLSQKETFIKSFEKQYAGFEEQYGAQPVVTETDNGAKISFDMSAEQAKDFYGNGSTKVTKAEVIKEFESQGFTCK